MASRPHRAVLTALLSLAFALSLSVSAAQAAAMSVEMAEMGMPGHPDCGSCPGNSQKDPAKPGLCIQYCAPALAAVLPLDPAFNAVEAAPRSDFAPILDLGLAPAPNPSPPRA